LIGEEWIEKECIQEDVQESKAFPKLLNI